MQKFNLTIMQKTVHLWQGQIKCCYTKNSEVLWIDRCDKLFHSLKFYMNNDNIKQNYITIMHNLNTICLAPFIKGGGLELPKIGKTNQP